MYPDHLIGSKTPIGCFAKISAILSSKMSRKAQIADEVKAGWNSVKFYELTRGYAAPKALPTLPEGAIVILHHNSKKLAGETSNESVQHPFLWLAPMLHPLLFPTEDDGNEPPMILLLDLSELCNNDEEMINNLNMEGNNKEFEKIVGKPVARAIEKVKGITYSLVNISQNDSYIYI